MSEIVNQIRNEITATDLTAEAAASAGRNMDGVRAGAAAARDTLAEMGDAGAAATQAVADGADGIAQSLQESVAKASAGVSAMRASLRNLKKEEADLQTQLDKATASGADTQEITQNLSHVQGQISAATSSLGKMRQEQQAARVSLEAWNGSLGQSSDEMNGFVGAVAQATVGSQKFFNGLTSGSTSSLKSVLTNSRALGDELAAVLLKANAAEERMAKLQVQLPAAVSSNQLSQQDADAMLAQAQAVVDKYRQQAAAIRAAREETEKSTKAIRLEGYQVTQLVDEGHKFLDMVLAGGSPLTAAFYQLPNAIQAAGGKANALLLLRNALFGPAGIAAAAGAAGLALYKMGDYAEDEASKFLHLQQQLRGTRDDAASMADAITSASKSMENMPGWDKATARTAATAIGSTYNFSGGSADIQSLSNIARDYGASFGTLEDGLKAVTTAMQDPTSEIEALYKQHLPGVDQQLVEQVRRLQAAGEQGKAYALVIDRIQSATHDAYENGLTPLQQSMEDLEKAASPLMDVIGKVARALGRTLVNDLTDLVNTVTWAAKKLHLISSDDPGLSATGKQVVTNQAHPEMVGLMQINSKFASQYDINTVSGNIDEAITRFKNFQKQANGNLDDTLAMYGGFKAGSSGGRQYASSVYRQDLSKLDAPIASAIDKESEKFGLGYGLTNVFKKISLQESGGHQFVDQKYQKTIPVSEPGHATSPAVIDNGRSVTGGSGDASGGNLSASWTSQQEDLKAQIQLLQTERDKLTVGTTAWKERDEALAQTKVALANTLSPQQQITQGLQDGLAPLQAQSGYWRNMAEVFADFDTKARGTGRDQDALTQALAIKQKQLAAAYEDGTVAAQRQAQSQQAIAESAGGSNQALQHAINYQQAYNEALEDFDPASDKFDDAVKRRTAELNKSTDAQQKAQMLQQNGQMDDSLTLIKAETASLGQNADERQVNLAVMQKDLELHRQYADVIPEEAQKNLELTQSISQASVELQHHQEVLDEVTSSISNMADQLTDGVTQGFLQGTSSGMSFKNVLKGIETQLAGTIIKMGLINPLLNKIDGKTRTTLDDVNQMFGQQTGGNSSSEGGLSSDQIGQYLDSGSGANDNNMTQQDQMDLFGNVESSASAGGISRNGKVTASNGMTVSDLQSLFGSGTSAKTSSDFGSMSDMFAGNGGLMSDSGQESASTAGGAMSLVGGVLGGLTTGYSLGKKASNLTGGGQGGKIGAAVGAGIGTAVGTVFGGPVGGMIGGTVLGAIGGIIGGLFNKTHRIYDSVIGSDGQLAIGGTRSKHAKDDVTEGLTTDLASVNAAYADAGITVSDGSYGEVGHYHKGKKHRSTALTDLLPNITLQSDDANENLALQQLMPKSFDSVSSYTQAIESIKQLADTLDALHVSVAKFDDQTHITVGHISGYTGDLGKVLSEFDGKTISTDALESQISTLKELLDITNSGAQSLVSQVADLRDKYQQAADQAKAYGLDYQVILDKGNAVAQAMLDAENTKLTQSDQSVQARYLAAVGDQQGADLVNFDVSADQQRQSLQDEWRSYLGDSFADNQTYAAQMADLDKTLAAERLKIQTTYADQALAAQQQAAQAAAEKQAEYLSEAQSSVASAFSNLADYVQGLGTSDASPLSVQDQYKLANDNFDTDYQAAMGGDYDALTRLQSESQTALSVDKQWLGSGTDYSKAYQDMLTKLQAIGNLGADTFTANLAKQLAAQQVDATLQVNKSIQTMQAAITAELKQFIRMQTLKAA